MKNALVIFLLLFIGGCAGVMDYESPALRISGSLQRPQQVRYIKPYDKKHMFNLLKSNNYSEVKSHNTGEARPHGNSDFNISLHGFIRSGLFWIIPPLGGFGSDHYSEVILKLDGFAPRGIVANPDNPQIYYYDTSRKKVLLDDSGFVEIEKLTRGKDDDPLNPGCTDTIDFLTIKINNFQPGAQAD